MKTYLILFVLILSSCSTHRTNRSPASTKGNYKNCYSSIIDFFKIHKKFSHESYNELLSLYAHQGKSETNLQYDLFTKYGWPKNVAKRISEQDLETGREIITSPFGINSFFKSYRGMKISERYPVLKSSHKSNLMHWGGDYYSQSHGIAKDYAKDIFKMNQGLIIESYIPKIYTDLGVNQIWRSFRMTHENSLLFINRVSFQKTNGEKTPWMSLEQALEKGLLKID